MPLLVPVTQQELNDIDRKTRCSCQFHFNAFRRREPVRVCDACKLRAKAAALQSDV